MKKTIRARIGKFLSHAAAAASSSDADTSDQLTGVDVREEYAHAFRTESYNEFWTHVLALSNKAKGTVATVHQVESTTTAARLSSYRLFAEQLLEPDQSTVIRILDLARTHSLIQDYFAQTANASLLFGLLIKDIDNIRVKYRSFKIIVSSLEKVQNLPTSRFSSVTFQLTEFSDFANPFASSAPTTTRVRVVQAGCCKLLKQLESTRDKARAKLQLTNISKHGSATLLLAVTISLTVILASHALALLVTAPGLIAASLELSSSRRLARVSTHLDAAAKGTYILNIDLDTISRLMARLDDELEHMRSMVKFWLERGEVARLQASCEVARQLKKNDASFCQQLDELEEHLYLCFMTVNRARNLVMKEILDPGQPTTRILNI